MYLILKLSKLCNLRCVYCYEYDELGLRDRMPLDGLDRLFASSARLLGARSSQGAKIVLHGGEPSLLPGDYLRAVVELARDRFGAQGVPLAVAAQTNLVRARPEFLELLEELDVALGVSLDVFGGQRVDAAGRDAQIRVLENLQQLFDTGAIDRLHVGAISVLHAGNVGDAVATFEFYDSLGLDYRVLPMFSVTEPPPRIRPLELDHSAVVRAMQAVALRMLAPGRHVRVFPIWNHLDAAVRVMLELPTRTYDPALGEWAVVVNTNGDTYTHGDAYTRDGHLGNAFTHDLDVILDSPARRRAVQIRAERAAVCAGCSYGHYCSRVPLVEALPSEREFDADGRLQCAVAQPMITFLLDWIRRTPRAAAHVQELRLAGAPEGATALVWS